MLFFLQKTMQRKDDVTPAKDRPAEVVGEAIVWLLILRQPSTLPIVYVTDRHQLLTCRRRWQQSFNPIHVLSGPRQESHHQIHPLSPHKMSQNNSDHIEKNLHELPVATKRASSHETFKLVLQTIQTAALVGLVAVLAIFVSKLGNLSSIEQILDSAIYNPEDRFGYVRVSSSQSNPVWVDAVPKV